MNLLFLSVISTAVCVLIVVLFRYLSLLRWISGDAYVLSKKKDHFSILELLDLFKNVKPFPISNQKGWKIDRYSHGHRIWFSFLTFPHNANAPSIKAYAAFDRVGTSAQALIQVLKDISQTCEWKPGVVSSSHTHNLKSHEVPSVNRGLPSMPVQIDCVKEERLIETESKFALHYLDPWVSENVAPTESMEFKRFWHREDNGVCWLLQMNERLQISEFYLIQPVEDIERCLLSVVTWSQTHSPSSKDRPSILLSSLKEYISLRRVQKTPLTTITLPQDLSESELESSDSQRHESFSSDKPLFSKVKNFILDRQSSNNSSDRSPKTKKKKAELKKYSSILRYRSHKGSTSSVASNGVKAVRTPSVGVEFHHLEQFTPLHTSEEKQGVNRASNGQRVKAPLMRSVSDGRALKESRMMNRQLEDRELETDESDNDDVDKNDGDDEKEEEEEEEALGSADEADGAENQDGNIPVAISEQDLQVARFKTISNQCAAELMAEAMRASNIDLELSSELQAESSGGWLFSSFEKNIVVLKKMPRAGNSVQSYIGKGFVLAPPKTVWDAVKNPRTRFTYDDTLKKVDILETIDSTLKIVYFYHESQQFLMKNSCDMCVLQGERQEGEKYILTYSSIEHEKCPVQLNVTRATFHPSGWIIEPAHQDNKVYSIVTYVMQVDFGPSKDGSQSFPFEEMVTRYPLSIADLQQYLKPAVQMLRRKSLS